MLGSNAPQIFKGFGANNHAYQPELPELDDEDAIIAASLLCNENLIKIQEWILTPDCFQKITNREIYKALLSLGKSKKNIDLISIRSYLQDAGLLKLVEENRRISDYLSTSTSFSESNIIGWCKSVHQKWIISDLKAKAQQLIDKCSSPIVSAKEVLDFAEKSFYQVRQNYEKPQESSGGYILPLAHQVYEDASTGEGKGISTGFSVLDKKTNGLPRGALFTIGGLTGTGKTHVLCELAHNMAILNPQNLPVLFLTGEMSPKQIATRILSRVTVGASTSQYGNDKEIGVTSDRIIRGGDELDGDDWEKMSIALGKLGGKRMFIDWLPANVDRIPEKLKILRSQNHGQLGGLFIDYFQLMGASEAGEDGGSISANRVVELNYISRRLKKIAQEFDIPVVVASQVRREVEQRKNKRPDVSDLAWCAGLANDSDLIGLLHREELHDKDTPDKGVLEFLVKKIRASGELGEVKFFFDPQFSRLRQMAVAFG
ncbi:MAG TPA: DnaB-like helicase C-terminal domain-containing protein [Phormidium sp.]